ncbi:MAG: hypothetical protein WAW75_01265 [Gallionella sp.]
MCEIDWTLTAAMLGGVGAFLTGIAALFVLPIQLGFKKEAKKSKEEVEHLQMSLKLMFPIYKQYMASEEGIVWGDYPENAEQIINGISRKAALDKELVRRILDELKAEGKI